MARESSGYADRMNAGKVLAAELARFRGKGALVLGLPRGGVPVASEVAEQLGAELDVLVARKLGAPGQPEFGFGAIAPGARYIDHRIVSELALKPAEIKAIEARESIELRRRMESYRGSQGEPDVMGRIVILVDDGVATGATARAALQSLRRQHPAELVFAAPVGPQGVAKLLPEADEVVVPFTPGGFHAVGQWYRKFDQTSDAEVMRILARRRRARPLEKLPVRP